MAAPTKLRRQCSVGFIDGRPYEEVLKENLLDLYDAAIRGVKVGLAKRGCTVSERARFEARMEVLKRVRMEISEGEFPRGCK